MIKDIAVPIIAFIISFVTVILLHPYLVKLALHKQIVDKPNARRLNRIPIPVLGGVGVFAGFAMASSICTAIFGTGLDVVCLVAITMMLAVGFIDDIKDLKPKTKFATQILAILMLIIFCGLKIDNLHGVFGIYAIPDYASIPLTIFSCVGLINAINLIDGIDGLSSGYGIAAGAIFCIFGYVQGNTSNILLSASIVGALIPFFVYNVFGTKNKMFIGDSGSHLLGIIFCILILSTIHNYTPSESDSYTNNGIMAFCLAVMAHPVMDTLRVMTMRIINGNSPFKADKTHLHHAIINAGFSHLNTTLIIISLNLIVLAIWFATFITGMSATAQIITTLCSSIFFIIVPYFMITIHNKKHKAGTNAVEAKH